MKAYLQAKKKKKNLQSATIIGNIIPPSSLNAGSVTSVQCE